MSRPMPVIEVSQLLARTTEDIDGCLLWSGCLCDNKPRWNIGSYPFVVRRLVWFAMGRPFQNSMGISARCGKLRCVHPDCLTQKNPSQRHIGRKKTPLHRHRIGVAKRAHRPELTPEQVDQVRSASSARKVAKDMGLSLPHVQQLRRAAHLPNPFAGLLS